MGNDGESSPFQDVLLVFRHDLIIVPWNRRARWRAECIGIGTPEYNVPLTTGRHHRSNFLGTSDIPNQLYPYLWASWVGLG